MEKMGGDLSPRKGAMEWSNPDVRYQRWFSSRGAGDNLITSTGERGRDALGKGDGSHFLDCQSPWTYADPMPRRARSIQGGYVYHVLVTVREGFSHTFDDSGSQTGAVGWGFRDFAAGLHPKRACFDRECGRTHACRNHSAHTPPALDIEGLVRNQPHQCTRWSANDQFSPRPGIS